MTEALFVVAVCAALMGFAVLFIVGAIHIASIIADYFYPLRLVGSFASSEQARRNFRVFSGSLLFIMLMSSICLNLLTGVHHV